MQLNVEIKNRVANYQEGDETPICGNSGDTVKFLFDDEWAAHEKKTARFIWGGKYHDVEFTGDTCEVPVVTNTQSILVGVYVGEEADDEPVLSTTTTTVAYLLSVRCKKIGAHGESGKNYTNEAKGYAEAAAQSAASAKASEEATAGAGAEVQAHQAYYNMMADAVVTGLWWDTENDRDGVVIVPEGTKKFSNGGNEKGVVFPNGLEEILSSAYLRCMLQFMRIPPSVKKIGASAFYDNRLKGNIYIPRNVEILESEAFGMNAELTSVTFASNSKLQSIGPYAFASTKIKNFVIPKSVTWIGESAFELNGYDEQVYVDLTAYGYDTPFPNIGGYIYNASYGCTVYVPKGRKAELLAMTNWATGGYSVYEMEV